MGWYSGKLLLFGHARESNLCASLTSISTALHNTRYQMPDLVDIFLASGHKGVAGGMPLSSMAWPCAESKHAHRLHRSTEDQENRKSHPFSAFFAASSGSRDGTPPIVVVSSA